MVRKPYFRILWFHNTKNGRLFQDVFLYKSPKKVANSAFFLFYIVKIRTYPAPLRYNCKMQNSCAIALFSGW